VSVGDLALVLHAHLPFIRHPEHRYHLEENWLYEATLATYLPLLEVLRGLEHDRVPWRMTLSMSPPLCSMLRDDLLKTRTAAYLDRTLRLGDAEVRRTAGDATFQPLARWYHERFTRLKALYDAIQGDLVGAFSALQAAGSLEIITVGATHGYLPVIREVSARRAQIQVACDHYARCFDRWPRGIWLPECGYAEGVDALLAEAGLRYFIIDAHGIANARPRPPLGLAAPIYCKSGVAAFGRDLESSAQVWSAKEGYPGDADYRDFYRDIGFDLPLEQVGPYVHPDGIRVHTGFKYFRVTGAGVDLAHKAPYDPMAARERAAVHAGNFVFNRGKQMEHLAEHMDRRPIVVSPYDAELYGHWWFEGPQFLDFLFRKMHFDQDVVKPTTPSEYLGRFGDLEVCQPPMCTWGAQGYAEVWLNGSNDWIYPHLDVAGERMVELARRYEHADGLAGRGLNQAARELLLAQSSDWAFIMKTNTTVEYAKKRTRDHVARFDYLYRALTGQCALEEPILREFEERDNVFPEIDYRVYR